MDFAGGGKSPPGFVLGMEGENDIPRKGLEFTVGLLLLPAPDDDFIVDRRGDEAVSARPPPRRSPIPVAVGAFRFRFRRRFSFGIFLSFEDRRRWDPSEAEGRI